MILADTGSGVMPLLILIFIALTFCIALAFPVIILTRIPRLRRRSAPTPAVPPAGEPAVTPAPEPQAEAPDSEWGQTRYGFDDTEWSSTFDDEPGSSKPRRVD